MIRALALKSGVAYSCAALALALAPVPACAFSLGCDLKPAWLCFVGSTWWQGKSDAEGRAYVLAHCHDEPAVVICREGSRLVRIPKGGRT
jgi:hypothetical protein